ncbi:endonuclease/exonuclease/phosphatase family protein [Rubripirellula lacrimiformis]|uniref:endonuclease/exonuclease/phosphatase family protein n=1 Tax=Rubripirellula lacrimiformis TaxID=1930273 RepID=UPI001C54DBD7|nr:endonuclease/exonuclease/phosphatase family protein [Rubripirellula lacrimiformis]
MAKRRRRAGRRSWLSTAIRFLLLGITSGGIGGYVKPDLPIIGPLVQKVFERGETNPDIESITDRLSKAAKDSLAASGGLLGPGGMVASGNGAERDGLIPRMGDARSDAMDRPSTAAADRAIEGSRPTTASTTAPSTGPTTAPTTGPTTGPLPNQTSPISPGGGSGPLRSDAQLAASRQPNDRLRIATFNIQVFGESKMSKPDVVEILASVIRQFDVVAIQEIRAQSDEILPRFMQSVNADGSRYAFLIGERIGRTVSTEQYAFIYDTNRIEHDPYAVGTMSDANDLLHREPFVARFRSRTQSPADAFTFWMVNIHTDPDEASEEVAALADVFQVMQRARGDEDDVILLGDLNASDTQLGPLGQVPGINWVVRDTMTNTRQTKCYDNILFDRQLTSEYTGRWGVMNIEQAFGISREQALKVSDHLPVWAEFSIWETQRPETIAQAPGDLVR